MQNKKTRGQESLLNFSHLLISKKGGGLIILK